MTCPAIMYAVMCRCWEILPAKRATAKEIQGMLAAITLDQLDSDLIQVLLLIAFFLMLFKEYIVDVVVLVMMMVA